MWMTSWQSVCKLIPATARIWSREGKGNWLYSRLRLFTTECVSMRDCVLMVLGKEGSLWPVNWDRYLSSYLWLNLTWSIQNICGESTCTGVDWFFKRDVYEKYFKLQTSSTLCTRVISYALPSAFHWTNNHIAIYGTCKVAQTLHMHWTPRENAQHNY